MKKFIFMCLFLSVTLSLFAQDVTDENGDFVINNIFAGLGPEINVYTRDGIAIGGNILGGVDFFSFLAAGLKIGFFHDASTLGTMDIQAFFRFYLPVLRLPLEIDGPFVQAEVGAMFSTEDEKTYPSFAGGVLLGWHFNLPYNLYIEPSLRIGYPYMWGFGAVVGYKFILDGLR